MPEPFRVEETTITDIHVAMRAGEVTSRALVDAYLQRAAFRRSRKGGPEASVREQRRVDAMSELAELADRVLHLQVEALEQCRGSLRIGPDEVVCEAQLDGEGSEVLLRSVVDVALEPTAFGIAARDDPCPRLA